MRDSTGGSARGVSQKSDGKKLETESRLLPIVPVTVRNKLSDAFLHEIFAGLFQVASGHEKYGCLMYAKNLYNDGVRIMEQNIPSLVSMASMTKYYSRLGRFRTKSKRIHDFLECHINEKVFLKTIFLEEGLVGGGFDRIFTKYFEDKPVTEIHVHEKDLSTLTQVKRLISFLRYMIAKCRTLKFVYITSNTEMFENSSALVFQLFDNCRKAVKIDINNLNTNRIMFNNGYIFQSSVGLALFQDEFYHYLDYRMDTLAWKYADIKVFNFRRYSRMNARSY